MAPAIAHFLVGAALFLCIAAPVVLRYDIGRESAIWLIPLGGVWGLIPDIHNISPLFVDTLYGFHNMPWMDLFGLHYTLDRSAIRARYEASVFGSIMLFFVAVGAFTTAVQIRQRRFVAETPLERVGLRLGAAGIAAGFGTVAMGVVISIQSAFPSIGRLVGSASVLAGGLALIPIGIGLAVCFVIGLESLPWISREDPRIVSGIGCLFGGLCWLGGVVIALPLVFDLGSVPLVHWGGLAALVIYGSVFGVVYGLLRGAPIF